VTPDSPPRELRRRDALIQGATGLSVTQIFEQDGEESFRSVEAAVLNEVASYGRVVVSTGGGVVTRPQNWGHLRNGIVIYLEAPVECVIVSEVLTHNMQHSHASPALACVCSPSLLAARVAADGVARRPLLAGAPPGGEIEHARVKLQEVHAQRVDMYRQSDLTVAQLAQDGTNPPLSESPTATAGRVLAALASMLEGDDTKKRLRSAPQAGSMTLRGSTGPLQI